MKERGLSVLIHSPLNCSHHSAPGPLPLPLPLTPLLRYPLLATRYPLSNTRYPLPSTRYPLLQSPPDQLAWCGSDCVVLTWPEVVLMVGPGGDWLKHPYDEPAVLSAECDGCRVVTRSKHELVREEGGIPASAVPE